MGKWSKLKSSLVRFTQPVTWQQQIDKFKHGEYGKLTRQQLCAEYLRVDKEKELAKERISGLNTREEALNQLLLDHLETEGDSSIRNEFGTFYIKDDPYCSVEDRAAYSSWIRQEGMEELLTVNYQTTSGLVKTRLEAGEPIPPGITVFMKSTIGHRKSA
jgi:hypothetical protein